MNIGQIIGSGDMIVALPLALLAGLVSFASPCVLPLVPGYLAYVGGMSSQAEDDRRGRARMLLGVMLFIAGFTVVFVLMAVVSGLASQFFAAQAEVITRVLGAVIILMGFAFIGQVAFLQREWKVRFAPATGLVGAPLLGVAFAVGWVPCIGPTLAAIMSLSFQTGSVPRAVLLAVFYCLGIGVPFLLIALGLGWVTGAVAFLKRHIRTINIIGGAMLILIGLLMVTGLWGQLMSQLAVVISGFDTSL